MDKDKENIDHLFNEGFNNRSFKIPEFFESDLTQKLDEMDKKKRGFFFWFLLLFCIVDFSIIVLLLITPNQSPIYSMSNPIPDPIESFETFIDSINANKQIQIDELQDSKTGSQIKRTDSDVETHSLNSIKRNSSNPSSKHSTSKEKSASLIDNNRGSDMYTDSLEKDLNDLTSNEEQKSTKIRNNNLTEATTNKEGIINNVDPKTIKLTKQPDKAPSKEVKNIDSLVPTKEKKHSNSGNNNLSEKTTNAELITKNEGKEKNKHPEQVEHSLSKEDESDRSQKITSKEDDKKHLESPSTNEEANKNDEAFSIHDKTEKEDKADTNATKSNLETTPNESNVKNRSDTIYRTDQIKQDNDDTADLLSNKEKNSLNQGKKNISKWRTEIQLYTGFGSTIINDHTTSESYLGVINKDRKPLNTPTFGVNGNVSYKNTTFGLGLSYLQTGESYSTSLDKITYTDVSYFDYDSIVETIYYYEPYGVFIGDSTQLTVDTLTQTETISDTSIVLREIKNRYSWISVPVYFGYHFSFGKYELTPRIGAQFNVGIMQNSGRYPTSNFEALTTYNATRFNVSYLVNIELKRNFNKWSIFARPYFKSMIDPAINESLLKRKYSSWGVQLGVGFDL